MSVVIPVYDDAPALQRLLQRLGEEPGGLEVIVVDGGSRDASVDVARRASVRLLSSARGRGLQMNVGARAAAGNVLLFLHCDTLPPPGIPACLPALLQARRADFGAFRVRFDPPLRMLQVLALLSRLAVPWTCLGDQGIFVRRDFFEATGGFPEIPILEEVHWLRVAARSGRMMRAPHQAVTSARRFLARGTTRQLVHDFLILAGDWLGIDRHRLARSYYQ